MSSSDAAPMANVAQTYDGSSRASAGFNTALASITRTSITVHAPIAPPASARRGACSLRLLRANVSVTDVDEMMPPMSPATIAPCLGPTARRASHPRKVRPEKKSTSAHSSRGRTASYGPYGPAGSSGRMTQAMAAKRTLARSALSSSR
jgi:hypothetical protein